MVKLRLMTLDLGEVAVVEVPRVVQLVILEDDDPATLVAYCKILACLVEGDGSKKVIL